MKKFLVFLAMIMAFHYSAESQAIQLDSVFITATQINQKAYETGRSVELITEEDIQEMPVTSIDELLRYVSGVNINSRNGFGVQADIGIRGSTFTQILVMVDNVRFNDPLTGHFNNNFPLALADIHQIEVIKGPAASSYGADAVGGLIHIKTKSYVQKENKDELSSQVDIGYGDHGLLQSDVGIQYSKDKFSITGSYRILDSEGEELRNPNFDAGVAEDSLFNNNFNLQTASLSLAYRLDDSLRFYARFSNDRRDFKAKYFYTRSAFDESREETSNNWGQFAVISDFKKKKIELDFGYRVSTDFFEFNPLFAPNDHKMKQLFANVFQSNYINSTTTLAFGAQYLVREVESTDRGNHENTSIGIFAIFSKKFKNGLNSNVSLRLENDDVFGSELLPQVSLSYPMNNWVLRTSYGRSFRTPDFTERYISNNIALLSPGRNAGNPDLEAERSNSFDLGLDYKKDKLDFSLTGFYRASTNLIDFALTNQLDIPNLTNLQDSADYFYASNISNTDVFGFETSIGLNKWNLNNEVQTGIRLNYTYLETTGDAGELSKYISNHPTHNFSFLFDINFSNTIGLNINGNYITRQEELVESVEGNILASYFIANSKLYWNLNSDFSIYGKLLNATDTQYQEILGAKAPSRWWLFGLNWNLKK